MSDPTPNDVQRYIAQGLACEHLEVLGDGQHFFATIVCAAFEGASRVARHQLVYRALGDKMRAEIHALARFVRQPRQNPTATSLKAAAALAAAVEPVPAGSMAVQVSLPRSWTNF